MKRKCMRVVALIIAISVLFVQVDTVSANAVVNAPRVEQGCPQIQCMGFVAEWVAGLGVSAGRLVAFAFVLTLLGFVVENGISNAWENREEYLSYLTNLKEDFASWCADSKEWCSLKANDFDMWLDMVSQGTLDKSSDCWQAIKDYCVDLKTRIDKSNTAEDNSSGMVNVEGAGEWLQEHISLKDINSKSNAICANDLQGYQKIEKWTSPYDRWSSMYFLTSGKAQVVCLKFTDYWILVSATKGWHIDFSDDFLKNVGFVYENMYSEYPLGTSATNFYYLSDDIKGVAPFCGRVIFKRWISASDPFPNLNANVRVFDLGCPVSVVGNFDYGLNKWQTNTLLSLANGLVDGFDEWSVEFPRDDGITDEVAQGLTVAGGTSGVIERDGSLDNVDVVGVSGAKDDVVPIDWDNVSVEDLSNPYPYDDVKTVDLVDGVIVGTDTPIDKVVPPIDGSDTSSDRSNYTLSGLTELFPFCIPFDLVMLFQTLKADAVAPCFKWKFVYYVDGEKKTEDIVLDLSKFNKVAEILRMMELLAFMIALTIKTRDLIRG